MDFSGIPDPAAGILQCIGIDAFAIAPGPRDSDAIILARYWRKVAGDDCKLVRIAPAPGIREDTLGSVCGVDPRETVGLAIEAVKRRCAAIEPIEIAQQASHSLMVGVGQQLPIEAAIGVPLALLSKLTTHEQQLLAGMGPHEAEIGAQIGKALPAVARHLADQ